MTIKNKIPVFFLFGLFLCFINLEVYGQNQNAESEKYTFNQLYREAKYSELLSILEKETIRLLKSNDSIGFIKNQLRLVDVYRATENMNLSLKTLSRIEPIIKTIDKKALTYQFYHLKGAIHFEIKNNDSARFYSTKALNVSYELEDLSKSVYEMLTLGAIYRDSDKDSSLHLLRTANINAQTLNDTNLISLSYINMAHTFDVFNLPDSAFTYAKKSLEYSIPTNIKVYQVMAYNTIVNYYDSKKDYVKAYEFVKKREEVSFAFENVKHKNKIKELSENLENIQQEKERDLLLTQISLEEEIIKRRNIQLGLTLFIFLLVVVLSYSYYRTNKKQQEQMFLLNDLNQEREKIIIELESVNEIKNSILSIIGHDLRSPFSNLISYLAMLEEVELSGDDRTEILNSTKDAAFNGMQMLDNLVNWANSNKEEFIADFQEVDLKKYGEAAISASEPRWIYKNISLKKDKLNTLHVQSDPHILEIIIRNLLANAIKFTPKGKSIAVSTYQEGNKAVLEIADSGIGMPKEVLKNLKESNGKITPERGTNGEKGIGLGLKLCMSFAELNQCEIKFKSNRPTGTIVKISFNLQNTKTLS